MADAPGDKVVVVIEFDRPENDMVEEVFQRLAYIINDQCKDVSNLQTRLGIRETAEQVIAVFEKDG